MLADSERRSGCVAATAVPQFGTMSVSRPLPVLVPAIANQRWSCHSCGQCCRSLVGHLTEAECERIDRQEWREQLGVEPYVLVGRRALLNKQADGACVFLTDDNRCMIHAKYGEEAKPLACRIFPFSVRPTERGWQASFRFDCPSAAASDGSPLSQHTGSLNRVVAELEHAPPAGDGATCLQPRVPATAAEVDAVTSRYVRWLGQRELPLRHRLLGAARVTSTLATAKLKTVRGARLTELVDLLFDAAPGERTQEPRTPTRRQSAMLRQLVFAHAEHVSLPELRSGLSGRLKKRWRQMLVARRFLAGKGVVPQLPDIKNRVAFAAGDAIQPPRDQLDQIDDLLTRYLIARVESRSVFGQGYYGWPTFLGLTALFLSVAAAGWLAKHKAAADGRPRLCFDDVAHAIGIVDRAATRLPALGTATERARVRYLLLDDGVARLAHQYAPVGNPT